MLDVSDEIYKKTLEEQAEYERLLEVRRRKELGFFLGLRTWALGVGSLAALVLGINPRFRVLLFAGLAFMPFFVWQLSCLIHKDKYVEKRVLAESEERRLAHLEERNQIRQNLMEQKKAQDEIDRLKAEISEMKKRGEDKA